jgi:PKD repeat protein
VTVGATLSPAPVVQVRDGQGHDVAVAGIEITVGLSQGNGQLNGTKTVATDGNGRAQFNDLSISNGSGTHKLIFAADGFRSATSTKIEVEKASTTTSVSADPGPSNPGDPVTVTVTVSSPAGTPTGEVEIKANGSPSCTVSAPQGSCQVTPTSSGDITATYKGNDVFSSSSATTPHQVNQPPPPNDAPTAEFTHADCVGGSPCQFTDTSTDPQGNSTIVSWNWNFGDGTPVSTEQNPSHVFNASIFPYLVTLTVQDDQGATNTITHDVLVQ